MSWVDVRTIAVLEVYASAASVHQCWYRAEYSWYPACFGFFCSVIGYLHLSLFFFSGRPSRPGTAHT